MQLLLLDVKEAERVGAGFPEGAFAEGASRAEPWLCWTREDVSARNLRREGEMGRKKVNCEA